jgi:hypothetical protein
MAFLTAEDRRELTGAALNLTEAELREITKRRRYSAQAKQLRAMGIRFISRPDGFPLVARTHYLSLFGGGKVKTTKMPDLDALQ